MAIPQFLAQTFGKKVDRATANLPQTAQAPIFTISGGRILLTALVGEVTTIIQAQATTLKVTMNPTVGADVDLSATGDINAKAVGTLLGITGVAANALIMANGVLLGQMAVPAVLPVGTLDIVTGASSTGQVKWSLVYIPLDNAARVVAA